MNERFKVIHGKDITDLSRQEIEQVNEGIDDYIDENADRLKETIRLVDEDDERIIRLGKAFVICSMFPEVFGGVPLGKFKALFME